MKAPDDDKCFPGCRCLRCVDARCQRRFRENADLIGRMRRGESLACVERQATWWPPRPIIKKDPRLVAAVLGQTQKASTAKLEVVDEHG